MSVPNFEGMNFKDYPNCAIFGAIAGSLGTVIIFISGFCIYKRFLIYRDRYRKKKILKRRKQSAPVEKVLSPRMSEHKAEPIYEDITAVDRLVETQNLVGRRPVELPPSVPALHSNMTFSTISQDTQSLSVFEGEGSESAPTNIIPPYISRYDSLVTWLKNMSTGVQE